MTHSTEQLSAEMANIDYIMQDLNAIKDGFEMAWHPLAHGAIFGHHSSY